MDSSAAAGGPGVLEARAGGLALEAGGSEGEQLEALLVVSAPASQRPWRRWARAALAAWAGATAVCLLLALGTHSPALPRAPLLGAARPARADVAEAVSAAAEEEMELLEGQWAYGKYGLYHTSRDVHGRWQFHEQLTTGEDVRGALRPIGEWLEGNLSTADGALQGMIRLRRGHGRTLVSKYLPGGLGRWSEAEDVVAHSTSNDYYVILEVFRLSGTKLIFGGLYHSQMAICPKSQFSPQERGVLDGLKLDPVQGYAEVPSELWRQSSASCRRLSYGGLPSAARCSGVSSEALPLASDRAEITNVDPGVAWKYLYGDGPFSGAQAGSRICENRCGDHWSGAEYSLTSKNCNTFTSEVLHCVYGLSQVKPGLGISDMTWATCDC